MDVWDPDEEERYRLEHGSYKGAAFSFLSTPRGSKHWAEGLYGKGSILSQYIHQMANRPDRGPTIVGLDAGIVGSDYTAIERRTVAQIAEVYKVPVDMLADSHFDMEAEIKRDAIESITRAEHERLFYGTGPIFSVGECRVERDKLTIDVEARWPTPLRYIDAKIEFGGAKADWVIQDELPSLGARGCAGRGFLSSPGGSSPPRSTTPPLVDGYQDVTYGGYIIPPELSDTLDEMLTSGKTKWVGEPRKIVTWDPLPETNPVTSSSDGVLTVEHLIELCNELKRGYRPLLPFHQPTRINPMKTSKIAIPYDRDNPTQASLVDLPRHCEVVHISGNEESAFLHIAQADDPSNAKTPTAFFVAADGVDVPGWVVTGKNGKAHRDPRYDDNGNIRDADTPEPVFVRRVGKFEREGEVFFVFERLS